METQNAVTIRLALPHQQSAREPVFLAGTLNDWQPGHESFRMQADDEPGWLTLTIPNPPDELPFKFTRGTWATEEVNEAGLPVPNRIWRAATDGPTMATTVGGWRDDWQQAESDTVRVWYDAMWIPQLNRHRRIWVCVPPDYNQTSRSYPVIYMHDAQNLFGGQSTQNATWRVSHTLNRLFDRTGWGCIVIGIEHSDTDRLSEYSVAPNPAYGGGEGRAYLAFLTETLKPLVDATFRTLPKPEQTAMIGSSMGGLISVYAALLHGDVFGKVAAFSPSLWWSDDVYALAATAPYNFVHKLVLLAGAQESQEMLPDVLAMYYTLIDNGYFEEKIQLDFYQDGTHNEWFWGRELDRAIYWLFSDELPTMPDKPLAVVDKKQGEIRLLRPFIHANLLNGYGKIISRLRAADGNQMAIKPHWHGLFALQCLLPDQRIELKKIVL